jgi:FkbM family methyltransferase
LSIIKNYISDIWFIINPFRIKKTAGNFLMYISYDTFGKLISKGEYDKKETKLIEELDLRDKVIYDVGAHHGYYSFLFSKCVGNNGKVFAFEPSPRERFYFKVSKFLNYSKNITLVPFGVSSKCKKTIFYQAQGIWTGFNSLRPPRYPEGYKVKTKKIIIDLINLDSFVLSDNLPFLIKMDIEGAEFSAVKGAVRLIKSVHPLFLMEMDDRRSKAWNYRIKELVLYLKKFGYMQFRITEDGYLEEVKKENIYKDNYFLVPKESINKFKYLLKNKYLNQTTLVRK